MLHAPCSMPYALCPPLLTTDTQIGELVEIEKMLHKIEPTMQDAQYWNSLSTSRVQSPHVGYGI